MECVCEIDYDFANEGDESESIIDPVIVTAENVIKCHECKYEIQPGEKYEYVKGRLVQYEEEWEAITCESCLDIRASLFTGSYLYGEIWDAIFEFVNDCQGDIPEDCISGIHPRARAKLCGIIEYFWRD